MSNAILDINIQTLQSASDSLGRYVQVCKNNFTKTTNELGYLRSDWRDEDYADLVAAVNALKKDAEIIIKQANGIKKKIDGKLAMIEQLYNIKI